MVQHGIYKVCPDSGVRKCEDTIGVLTYTAKSCYLRLDTVARTYAVVRWLPREKILHVRGGNFTGFFLIKDRYATFVVIPTNKRYKERTITYRFYETIYYDYEY